MGRLITTEKKKSDNPKVKAEAINKELYEGEIPSIVGLAICLVRHPDKEMLIFVKDKHINRVRKKYGRNFLNVCGTVIRDPKKVPAKKPVVRLGELDDIDEITEIDEIIIQESKRRTSKPVFEQEVEEEYDPYADVRPGEETEQEDEDPKPKKRIRQPMQPAKPKYKKPHSKVLSRFQFSIIELWKTGKNLSEIAGRLNKTTGHIRGSQNLIFSKLGGDLYPDFREEFINLLPTLEYEVEPEEEVENLPEAFEPITEPDSDEVFDKPVQPVVITFRDFIKEYGSNRDLIQAEKIFNNIPDHDRIKIMEHLPSYNASISNPMYKKSPVLYLTGRSWNLRR